VSTAVDSANTRQQILHVARNLIQTRSYLGFSFQDIADAIGIRKPSLYHHFPSKEALGVEVLTDAANAFRKWAALTPRAPGRKLSAYFAMYRNSLRAGRGVCPAGALATGWDCIDSQLRDAVRALRETQIRWLTEIFRTANPRARRRAGERAAFVFAACQGALLSARMTGAVEDFDAAIAQMRAAMTPPNLFNVDFQE
jgi:TetR/AcrR family transcriptional regulator, transcriptional repressor for nem operon